MVMMTHVCIKGIYLHLYFIFCNYMDNTLAGADFNGDENSGGLAMWIVYIIIAVIAVAVIAVAVWYVKGRIQETREDGSIIRDVGEALTDALNKKTADDLLEVAIRAQTESAQLNADMETAKQLFALGQVSQAQVDKAVNAAEISKATAIQKNTEAAKALEAFRKRELAVANKTVLEATQKATGLSQEYEKLSDGITGEKVAEANAVLLELVKKRQQAEADYTDAVDTKNKAELAFLDNKRARLAGKRGAVAEINKKLLDLKARIARAKINKPLPPRPNPPKPTPPPNPTPPPKPVPKPPPKPKTALEKAYEKAYPYWGSGVHEGMRCARPDNTGCIWGADFAREYNKPKPPPAPKPAPSSNVISTLDLRKLTSGGNDWNTSKVRLNKSNITQFRGDDVIYCWYQKGSGTGANKSSGGFSFNAKPRGMNQDAITFSWDVFYPSGFDFSKGGKYGGVHVGTGDAAGGDHSPDGASSRLMWQSKGGVISYAYPPSGVKQNNRDMGGGNGCGFGCAPVRFGENTIKYDQWNTIAVGTKVNTFNGNSPNADGEVYVEVNGERKTAGGIVWSRFPNKKITEFDMSTFFGGSWVSPKNQFCYFKNFRMLKY